MTLFVDFALSVLSVPLEMKDIDTTTTSFGVDVTTFCFRMGLLPPWKCPLLFIISLIGVSVAQDSLRGG